MKVVVFNNGALGFIELEQKSTGFLTTGTALQNPNFAAMAEAAGVRGIRLEDPGDVEAGIAAALAHDGPLVDAVVNRTELALPPAVTTEMAKGFTLYMVKAVMSGRGDELIEVDQFVPGIAAMVDDVRVQAARRPHLSYPPSRQSLANYWQAAFAAICADPPLWNP